MSTCFATYKCINDMSGPKSWFGIGPESWLLLKWLQRSHNITSLEKKHERNRAKMEEGSRLTSALWL